MVLHHFIKSKKVRISAIIWSTILLVFMDITGGIAYLYNKNIKIKSEYLYVRAKKKLSDQRWKKIYIKQTLINIQKHIPVFWSDIYYGVIKGEKYFIILDKSDIEESTFWKFFYFLKIQFDIWIIKTQLIYLILLFDVRSLIYGYLACKK